MKIKNEIIELKIGKKIYSFQNYILDEYLNTFVRTQLSTEELTSIKNSKSLRCCLLKFDSKAILDPDGNLYPRDFNVMSLNTYDLKQEISKKQITVKYNYDFRMIRDVAGNSNTTISNYNGKKITALGFTTTWMTQLFNLPIKAYLDVSNYNIYVQENEEISITRKDIIETEADFYSPFSNIKAPLHLMPCGMDGETNVQVNFAQLYSVGYSSYKDRMDIEYLIKNKQVVKQTSKIIIYELNNTESAKEDLQPQNNIYPSVNLFPLKADYNYLILKYKIFKNQDSAYLDTGQYYHMLIKPKTGNANLTINYERG